MAGAKFTLAVLLAGVENQRLILVVEDDEPTRSFLLENLAADGFRVAGATSAAEALRAIEVRQPALVVLDLRLEGGSGLDVLDGVRSADGMASRLDPDLPVIVLSGRAGVGGQGRQLTGVMRVGDLTIDPATRAVRLAGRRVELSAKEFALLHRLAEQPTRVYRKHELLRDVWGYLSIGNTRTLDAHACRLRKKLRSGTARQWVVNVRGVGYKLTEAL